MRALDRLNKHLHARFGDAVRAYEEDGCVVLRGALPAWEDVVAAGRMAVDRRRYAGVVNDIHFTGAPIPPMRMPSVSDMSLEGQRPDVLIIGGGIVGCAIARELTRHQLDVLLVEKEHDVAMQASSRNDGMVHPGVDLLPGQVKRRYNAMGNRMYDRVTGELEVPFTRCGQYLCVHRPLFVAAAFAAQLYYLLLGVPARFLTRRALKKREPALSPGIRAALFFPTAGTVCPYGLTIAYAENAAENGARFSFDTAVTAMSVENGRIQSVTTNRGTVYPAVVVNAAGVFSDEVAEMARDRFFSIHPRRGTNSILDHKAAPQVRTIASSLGTASTKKQHTKGGGLVHTIDNNLLVGPDACETFERENYATYASGVRNTFDRQRHTSPGLSERDIITYFTGVRAATYEEDFVIGKGRRTHNLVHAAGIQSPGLTAAPAIGVAVADMAVSLLQETRAVAPNASFDPHRAAIVRPADLSGVARDALIRREPDYGEIVCRCEQVSRGEIIAALHRAIPCDTVDGVTRRVRPGMGRCQGGFCGPLVLDIIARETCAAPERVQKSGPGSELLLGRTKA